MKYRGCTIEDNDRFGYDWYTPDGVGGYQKTIALCEEVIDDYWHDKEINDMNQLENLKEWVEEAKKVLVDYDYDDDELAARVSAYDHVLTMIKRLEE